MSDTIVILDNIRSAHNVGSVFRTCDAAGVSKIFLLGITPTPIDRFGRPQPEIQKTSLGAVDTVEWEHIGSGETRAVEEGLELIVRLKESGYSIVVVEQVPHSVSFYDFEPTPKTVFIFGAEVEGVHPEIIAAADQVLEIPMAGQKESLNVSVTTGIVLFGTKKC